MYHKPVLYGLSHWAKLCLRRHNRGLDMRIENCEKCQKRYSVTEIGGGMPGTKESEDITCPHCGNTFTERSNGAFKTSALPDDVNSKST